VPVYEGFDINDMEFRKGLRHDHVRVPARFGGGTECYACGESGVPCLIIALLGALEVAERLTVSLERELEKERP